MPRLRNDDDGDDRQQVRCPFGDEQHAASHTTGNNDPERTGKLREEDSCPQLLHSYQIAHDKER